MLVVLLLLDGFKNVVIGVFSSSFQLATKNELYMVKRHLSNFLIQ